MSIRLSKVVKEFNVGIQTVAEFLQKNGHPEVDANPNTKITDEQYDVLVRKFNPDKNLRNEAEKMIHDRQHKAKKNTIALDSSNEVKTVVPEDKRPKVKQVGRIDLDQPRAKVAESVKGESKPEKQVEPKKEKKVMPKVEVVAEPKVEAPKAVVVEPKVETPAPQKVEEKPIVKSEPVAEAVQAPTSSEPQSVESAVDGSSTSADGLFRLNAKPTEGVGLKVMGKIDLSAINQSTRPKKKTKDERRKEREVKADEAGQKRKRNRIGNERVDVSAESKKTGTTPQGANATGGNAAGGHRRAGQSSAGGANSNHNRSQGGQQSGGHTGGYNRSGGPNAGGAQNVGRRNKKKPIQSQPLKPEVSDEDVAKQVKETLARLTSKGKIGKGAKYRKERRDQARANFEEMRSEAEAESRILKLTEFVTANELASMMDIPVTQVIGTCMTIGIMVSINQRLDAETINLVAEEFGYSTEYVSADVSEAVQETVDSDEDLEPRAPIVTVMGHVDHGKTSLLDYIRRANVIAGEAGGITQHIGAYNVSLENGQKITFLDTPGHEAFTAMRARGAQVTDIAIIIIAADDAIMPQTKEAINHAVAADVPIVFAINKVDKATSNPDKIKEQLAAMNFLVEEWGGKYQSQDISAKQGTGVKELLEKVLLEAEMLELKANPNRKATGTIIESSLDKGRGYVATLLVSNGTLKMSDIVLAGTNYGRIKAMFNERNQRITQIGPSQAATILGLSGAPQAGDTFHVMDTEQEAREITNKREQLQREQGLRTQKMLTLDEVGRRIALGGFQELNVIVKGDVDGSIEALGDSLIKLSTEKIAVNVIHKAVGQISESDVSLAAASEAIIVGFQVRPSQAARRLADQQGVDIRLYSVIYDAIEEVKSAMEGMLAPELKEEITATIDVRVVYNITKVGTVAGAYVSSGKVTRSDKARLIRDGIVVHTGSINALKRFKDDVKEVGTNYECGISLNNYHDIREGDIIESFKEVEVKQKL